MFRGGVVDDEVDAQVRAAGVERRGQRPQIVDGAEARVDLVEGRDGVAAVVLAVAGLAAAASGAGR